MARRYGSWSCVLNGPHISFHSVFLSSVNPDNAMATRFRLLPANTATSIVQCFVIELDVFHIHCSQCFVIELDVFHIHCSQCFVIELDVFHIHCSPCFVIEHDVFHIHCSVFCY